jgi:hypothetical protein
MVEEALTLLESNMPLPLAQHRIRSIPSDKITEINDSLAKLNEEQLEEVKRSYKGRDGATLAADIEQRNEKTDNLNELEARLAGKGVEADAMALKKSIVRIGTDLPRIKKILSTRTSEQVDQIVEEYNKIDKNGIWRGKGKELFPALKSDLSGQDWEDVKSLLAKNNAFQKYIESIGETVSSEAEAETERKVGTRASTRENRGGRGTQPTAAEVESIVAEEQEETQTTIEAVNWIEKTLISENLENTKQLTKAIRETEAIHVKTLAEAYEMKTGKNLLSELEALKAKHEGSEHYGFYANPAEEFAKKIGS